MSTIKTTSVFIVSALALCAGVALLSVEMSRAQEVPKGPGISQSNESVSACNEFRGRSASIPRGFGAPYNFFRTQPTAQGNAIGGVYQQPYAVNIFADCDGVYRDVYDDEVAIVYGDGPMNTFVYERGYYWDASARQWRQLALTNLDAQKTGVWFAGMAAATIDTDRLQIGAEELNYVLGYTCTFVENTNGGIDRMTTNLNGEPGVWKCGCRDRQCAQNYWQLQMFTAPDSPEREEDHQAPVLQLDSDDDGIIDAYDNATFVANPDQRDTDGDGYGNVVDPDFNNNGVVDDDDQAYFEDAFGGTDPDADLNGDGFVNATDAAIVSKFIGYAPGPSYRTR